MKTQPFTYPERVLAHDPTPEIMETLMQDYSKTCITEPGDVRPGQILHGPRGYWWVSNVSIPRNRVVLERCIPDFKRNGAPLARTGKYEAVKLSRVHSNLDWHIYSQPVPVVSRDVIVAGAVSTAIVWGFIGLVWLVLR